MHYVLLCRWDRGEGLDGRGGGGRDLFAFRSPDDIDNLQNELVTLPWLPDCNYGTHFFALVLVWCRRQIMTYLFVTTKQLFSSILAARARLSLTSYPTFFRHCPQIISLPLSTLDSSSSQDFFALAASGNWGISKVRTVIDFLKSTVRLSELKWVLSRGQSFKANDLFL